MVRLNDERTLRVNPWQATHYGMDPARINRDISTAHRSFFEASDPATTVVKVRPIVRESWLRSRRRGLNLDTVIHTDLLTGLELDRYRIAHPMALIEPVVHKLLVEDAVDSNLLVAISDEQGCLLWVAGDRRTRDRAEGINFVEGANWSEKNVGTNAPGTALVLDQAVQIIGAEHFNRTAHQWSCSAVPVHDRTTGIIVGAIDVTGGTRAATPEMLQLVRATVAAAESELLLHKLRAPEPLSLPRNRLNAIGSDRAVLCREGSRISLSQRHAEILLLLAEYPEGLSTHKLAFLLDESELDSTTIRVEISRLRKVLGTTILSSRPYRLTGSP